MRPLLTPKREEFARLVVAGHNYTHAYRLAYDSDGMSDATISRRASELAANGEVRARIERLLAITNRNHEVTADRLTGELAAAAFANVYDYFEADDDGRVHLVSPDRLSMVQQHGVKKLKVTERTHEGEDGAVTTVTTEIELKDSMRAIELLSRRFPEFSAKILATGEMTHRHLFEQGVESMTAEQLYQVGLGLIAAGAPKTVVDVEEVPSEQEGQTR